MSTIGIASDAQAEIPTALCKENSLNSGAQFAFVDYGGVLTVFPLLSDPVKEAAGRFKGNGSLVRALLAERSKERIVQ